MLNLDSDTDPRWIVTALSDLDALLLDHAHCERKAAGMAVRLMFRYPDRPYLHDPLSKLAREELAHYEEVLRAMADRGGEMRRQKPSPYAGRLAHQIRGHEPARLLDTLLVSALIEARSCERFKLLAEAVDEPALEQLYRGLLACEARHHQVYLDLAIETAGECDARARLRELAAHEAQILANPVLDARMHA